MTTLWVWGTGWVTATLVSRQRAPGLDRCTYSGGPAHEVRGRLLVLLAGPWLLGRAACRSLEVRRSGRLVRGHPLMVEAYGAGGCTPRVRGHSCAGGGILRRRGRESCPRTRGLSPAGADRTRPRGMSPPASGMRSSAAAGRHDPRQSCAGPQRGTAGSPAGRRGYPSTQKTHG